MAIKAFKIIKKKSFTGSANGTAYTIAMCGRVVNATTLSFEDSDTVIKENTAGTHLEVEGAFDIVKSPYENDLGEKVMGLKMMPAFGIVVSNY